MNEEVDTREQLLRLSPLAHEGLDRIDVSAISRLSQCDLPKKQTCQT